MTKKQQHERKINPVKIKQALQNLSYRLNFFTIAQNFIENPVRLVSNININGSVSLQRIWNGRSVKR